MSIYNIKYDFNVRYELWITSLEHGWFGSQESQIEFYVARIIWLRVELNCS